MFIRLLVSLFTLLWPPPQVRIPGPGGAPAAASGSGIAFIDSAGSLTPSANGQASHNEAIGVEYAVVGGTQTACPIGWTSGGGNQSIVGAVFH